MLLLVGAAAGYVAPVLAAILLIAATPTADEAWDSFAEDRSGVCVGQAGDLAVPIEFEVGKIKYRLEGSKLVQTSPVAPEGLRVGVISATKDDRPATLGAIETLTAWMKTKSIDVLIANGDLATYELEMEKVFAKLTASGVLVVALIGNTESCGSFNRVATKTFRKNRGFINGNWVRRLDIGGATLLTLPGYYDRRFAHTGGAAKYSQKHVAALVEMAEDPAGPIVLVSHGPPKMSGKRGIDIAQDVGHVGCEMMATFIEESKIKFGIFGHILEAGGRGSDALGKASRKTGTWHSSLFINAGTANTDPWGLLGGGTSYGMAAVFELNKGKARYEIERLPRPQ